MNNAAPPFVSIIVPAYNAQRYLPEALESIERQEYPHRETIVVNDGSTDATGEVLARFGARVRVVTQENAGPAAARNAGIREARGSLIAFLDADDIWTDDHLAELLGPLASGEYDFVRGKTRYARNLGTKAEEMLDPIYLDALVGACLFRASVFERVGLFDETMRQGEDFDWNLRLDESTCREKRIEATTLLYRRHEHNLTRAREVVKQGQFEAFRKRMVRMKTRERAQA